MIKSFGRSFKEERAQSLVIVLLMLMVAAIIAVAISYRTIQDIRRTGEEKASSRAGTLAESILDVVTSPGTFETVIKDCAGAWGNDEICEIEKAELQTKYLGANSLEGYDDVGVMLRPEDGINGLLVKKDDVFELDLSGVGAGNICVGWEGSTVEHVTVRIFKQESQCFADADGDLDCTESAVALTYNDPSSWGSSNLKLLAPGACETIGFSGDAWVARIRPYGGDANITIDLPADFPDQVVSVKSYVYTDGATGDQIYREFLRRVSVTPSVPAVFDYVLFSGDGAIIK